MNKYDEMSDFELSEALSDIILLKNWYCTPENGNGISWVFGGNYGFNDGEREMIDINNPDDMWPIIVDNSITINYDTCQAHVSSYFAPSIKVSVARAKTLRAAAIVFLMMKDSAK